MTFGTSTVTGGARGRGATSRRSRRLVVGAALVVLLFGALSACSSDDDASTTTTTSAEQAYCEAWSNLVTAFKGYDQIDVVNQGLDSVRSYVDELDSSFSTFQDAASGHFGPQVDAFKTSLEDLSDALASPASGGVSTALDAVGTAWNDLVASLSPDCPDVTADTAVT